MTGRRAGAALRSDRRGGASRKAVSAERRRALPARLRRVVLRELGGAVEAETLVEGLLAYPGYDRAWVCRLLEHSRGGRGESLELRQLAILLLEHQWLKLAPGEEAELAFLCSRLGLLEEASRTPAVRTDVLRQGFSSCRLPEFALELRRYLSRNWKVHRAVDGQRTTAGALRAFLRLSGCACRLYLARYLLSPGEVVEKIVALTRTSDGTPSPFLTEHGRARSEVERALARLPEYEAAIVSELIRRRLVYWVDEGTPGEINSLLEYPLTTVVLVVKPPGSRVEIELKRAGLRRRQPLGVVFERQGRPVPNSHRLDGGSFGFHLEWEAQAAARVAILYRRAHGEEAPLPAVVALSSVEEIPFGGQRLSPRAYLESEWVFGEEYGEMRSALERSAAAFRRDAGGDAEGTATEELLGHVRLTQGVVLGTSSFRLDKLAQYLSSDGAQVYFRQGLGRRYHASEAKRFADDLLEEVVAGYTPPPRGAGSFGDYLEAAFAIPENRAAADACYIALVRRVARFWGTLLAAGSGSSGECFVPRNVGLRSVWEGGEWRVAIVFMDHDALRTGAPGLTDFWPQREILPIVRDEYFIVSDEGAIQALATIYRAAPEVVEGVRGQFLDTLKRAFTTTLRLIEEGEGLDGLFHESYRRRLSEWHELIRLRVGGRSEAESWKVRGEELLRSNGWHEKLLNGALEAVERHADFFTRYSFLYR